MQHQVFLVTQAWLRRVSGKFECELDSRLASGRTITMANQAHLLRDAVADRPIVFRMACMWVDALPEACALEPSRYVSDEVDVNRWRLWDGCLQQAV